MLLSQLYLLSAILSLTVGVLIYGRNPAHAVNRMFLVVCGILFYYEFVEGFEFLEAVNVSVAFQWIRFDAFWYLLPVSVLYLCIVYSNLRVRKSLIYSMYGLAVTLSLLELIVAPFEVVRASWGWAYQYSGYFAYVQVLWVTIPSVTSLLVLTKRYYTVRNRDEKVGVAYVFSGVLVPVATGIVVTVLPYISSVALPDLTGPAAAMGILVVGYAVYRFGIQVLTSGAAAEEILSTMVDALFLVDAEGKILESNKAASRLLEYDSIELIGMPLNMIDSDPGMAEALLQRGHPVRLETEFTTKHGRTVPVSISTSAVYTKQGSLTGHVFICRDISERKQMEAQLAETQRLATIGETASMVGHDLRNPLQAMVGSLWLLKELIMSKKPEDLKEAQDLLTTLRESARYMNKIVSDLQDYAGPVESETVEINPLEVVKTSLADVKIPENINVSVDVNGSSSGVRVDPALLRRVLTNLILNAVQAMPNGGKLRVYSTVEQESLTLSVEDSGVGIAPESLPKLFTPFFTTKAKGQGLGLAVCKRLMDVQGGRIDVTNHPGEGTIFTLKVPSKSRRRDSAEASVRKSG